MFTDCAEARRIDSDLAIHILLELFLKLLRCNTCHLFKVTVKVNIITYKEDIYEERHSNSNNSSKYNSFVGNSIWWHSVVSEAPITACG